MSRNKFIIFATARSGSTSLAKVLGESSDVKMAMEPFHESYSKWNPEERNYSEFITSPGKMGVALDEIFSKYTAMKVLDYQFDKDIYYSMLKRKDFKILFLRRKNVFEQALSSLVAEQTSKYHKQEDQSIYANLRPINVDEMTRMIDYIKSMNSDYLKFLEKNRRGDFLPLYYEDLYSDSLDQNVKNLTLICDFLKIETPPLKEIKKNMLPSEAKINFEGIYKNVPNYSDLETKFSVNS